MWWGRVKSLAKIASTTARRVANAFVCKRWHRVIGFPVPRGRATSCWRVCILDGKFWKRPAFIIIIIHRLNCPKIGYASVLVSKTTNLPALVVYPYTQRCIILLFTVVIIIRNVARPIINLYHIITEMSEMYGFSSYFIWRRRVCCSDFYYTYTCAKYKFASADRFSGN